LENKLKAIDLMLLDIKTSHPEIRVQAKKSNCEKELDILKDELIEYLIENRSKLKN
jgi:hypothetical protein